MRGKLELRDGRISVQSEIFRDQRTPSLLSNGKNSSTRSFAGAITRSRSGSRRVARQLDYLARKLVRVTVTFFRFSFYKYLVGRANVGKNN